MTLRILLADDHDLFRQAIRMTLQTALDVEVVAEVTDGQSVLDAVQKSHPDVVCMDINMPTLNGVEATALLHASHPHVKIIALSSHVDPHLIAKMMRAGAFAYVDKARAGSELLNAINLASKNQRFISPSMGITDIAELMREQD
jgi:two-component system NarL family response regulator